MIIQRHLNFNIVSEQLLAINLQLVWKISCYYHFIISIIIIVIIIIIINVILAHTLRPRQHVKNNAMRTYTWIIDS